MLAFALMMELVASPPSGPFAAPVWLGCEAMIAASVDAPPRVEAQALSVDGAHVAAAGGCTEVYVPEEVPADDIPQDVPADEGGEEAPVEGGEEAPVDGDEEFSEYDEWVEEEYFDAVGEGDAPAEDQTSGEEVVDGRGRGPGGGPAGGEGGGGGGAGGGGRGGEGPGGWEGGGGGFPPLRPALLG